MRLIFLLLFLVPSFAHAVPSNCCAHANALGIAYVSGVTTDPRWLGGKTMTVIFPTGLPWQGDTPATFAQQFPIVILYEFQTLTAEELNTQFELLSNSETNVGVARFSQMLWVTTQGNSYWTKINALAVQKLNPTNLDIWVRATYVPTSAPIFSSHAGHFQHGAVALTTNGEQTGTAALSWYMTFGETYNEFLFTVATTEEAALAMAAAYWAGPLSLAWLVGKEGGWVVNTIGTAVDPSFSADLAEVWLDMADIDLGCAYDNSCVNQAVSVTVGDPFETNDTGWCAKGDPSSCTRVLLSSKMISQMLMRSVRIRDAALSRV